MPPAPGLFGGASKNGSLSIVCSLWQCLSGFFGGALVLFGELPGAGVGAVW